jgi:putative chitinase
MITPGQLKTVFTQCRNPGNWVRVFTKTVEEFEITTDARLAMWLAQCGYESSHFNVLREVMSYRTVAQLRAVFPREFPTDDIAQKYVMNPQGLANFIYAGKNGNGDVASGDGFKYRGGGLIELTGKANYKAVGDALRLDLVQRPLQIQDEFTAARTAGFFWKQNDLNAAADAGDFDYTTRRVNGSAMEGSAERQKLWLGILGVLGQLTPVQAAQKARLATTPPKDGVMTPGGKFDQQRAEGPAQPAVATAGDFGL